MASNSKLKQSLAEALVEFYPLAGRLNVREDGFMEVLCNGQGVLFIEASASQVSLQELQKNDLNGHFEGIPVDLLHSLAQTGGHVLKWPWPSDAPLFIIQVTKLSCGGICMSIQFSHQLLDGTSAWHFVKSWAELNRGETISLRPRVQEIMPPAVASASKHELPPEFARHKRSDLLRLFAAPPDTSTQCEMKCFCFKKEMISMLKRENPGFSSFQLLTAHIWSRATAARKLPENETTSMLFMMNFRARVEWIPRGFVGEGAGLFGVSTRVGDLGVNSGAALFRNKIEECLEKASQNYKMLADHWDKEHAVFNRLYPGKDLNVGSSFYFQVFQDFGFGKAVGMTIVPIREDGKVYYFPGREEGDVAAYISLKPEVMKNLQLY